MKFFIERRGNATPEGLTDINNYRCGSYDYTIKDNNGRRYCVEFTRGDSYEQRYNRRTGNYNRIKAYKNIIYCNISYRNKGERNNAHGAPDLMYKINQLALPYNIKGITTALNIITGRRCQFAGFTN